MVETQAREWEWKQGREDERGIGKPSGRKHELRDPKRDFPLDILKCESKYEPLQLLLKEFT